MSNPIILTGTFGNAWQAYANDLAGEVGAIFSNSEAHSSSQPSKFIPCAEGELSDIISKFLQSRVIVFCDSPVSVILEAASKPESEHTALVLQRWIESAEIILSTWRRNRLRIFLLEWRDVVSYPNEFNQWMQDMFSAAFEFKAPIASPKIHSGLDSLAECVVREFPQANRLWSEMLSACQAFGKVPACNFTASPTQVTDTFSELAPFFAAQADLATRHQHLATERHAIAVRFEQTEAEREALASELESVKKQTEAEREALASELESVKKQSLQTHEMLLTEIHSAHLESEGFFEEWKTLEAATDFHHLQVGSVARGKENPSPAHSHLDFSFERLELFDRRWPRLAVRLVEHNGHAGLALFDSPAEKARPLYHWKPTGEEAGTGYMLFVPTDKPALDSLVALPATDLVLIRCLTARVLGHLSVHGEAHAGRWFAVARRLLQQIEELPERLHYDSVSATPVDGSAGKSIAFTLFRPYLRGAIAESFRWTWKSGPKGGELLITKNEAFPSLIMSWPVEKDSLCLGSETTEILEQTRSVWKRLLERDRSFLQMLAAAHSDFVFHLCEQHHSLQESQVRLKKQSIALSQLFRNLPIKDTAKKKKFFPFLS